MRVQRAETPGPRPGWLILLVAVAIVLITVWFREGDAGPIHRLRRGVQAASAPASAAGEFVTRPVRGFLGWASDIGVSRSQLEELRDQNASLRSRVAELEEARLENARLTELVKLTRPGDLEAVGARVIGRPSSAWEGVITIDRGSADGIETGMPVLGPLGLLGQTVEVSKSSAKVRLITDPRSGVAAMVQATRVEGIVNGSIDGHLSLDFVSRDATVTAGDVVITSGLGGVFPKGIIIGEVLEAVSTSGGLQQDIRITPASDPSALEEVLVLVGRAPSADVGGGE